jgi:REP-associated tyrosine transposase
MARPLRLQYPGALLHVISRGDAKQCIFVDDRDRAFFLDLLGECVTRFDWILYAYALMPNHFHLLVQLTSETLSKGMHWLDTSYAIAFNKRHDRVGHVLQGRFKSPPVEKESYLLQLIRYIVLNPFRANIVKRPEDYRWSSYRATIGLSPAPAWLAVDDVLLQFGPNRDPARAALRDFVNAAIGVESSIWKDLFERGYIGSDDWMAQMQERIDLKPRSSEHPRDQRFANSPSMSEVAAAVAETCGIEPARIRCGRGRAPRMITAWVAWKEASLPGSEIAEFLRLSNGRISQLVRMCDRQLDRDDRLREALSTISRKLKTKGLTPNSSS